MKALGKLVACASLAAALMFPSLGVRAQDADAKNFPNRPVNFIIPFGPGGPTDVIGRILAQGLQEKWGQPVVVQNRPGAGSIVGTAQVAKSKPDGYTIGLVITAHVINPAIRNDLPYDTLKDFTAITHIGSAQVVLLGSPEFPANDIKSVIAEARKQPGKLGYAIVGGIGSMTHLAGALLEQKADIKLRAIPFDGSGPALIDVQSNRVPLLFDLWGSARPHVQAGKLKLLGVGSSRPLDEFPDADMIPRIFPGYDATSIQGIIAPAGVPKPIVDKLSQDLQAVIRSEAASKRLRDYGVEPAGTSAEEWDRIIRREIARWTETAANAGIAKK